MKKKNVSYRAYRFSSIIKNYIISVTYDIYIYNCKHQVRYTQLIESDQYVMVVLLTVLGHIQTFIILQNAIIPAYIFGRPPRGPVYPSVFTPQLLATANNSYRYNIYRIHFSYYQNFTEISAIVTNERSVNS